MLETKMLKENGELTVILNGRIDTLTAPGLEKELEAALTEDVQRLILDVHNIDYISSAGLRTILAAQQYMEDHDLSDVRVINLSEEVDEIFTVTGFNKLVDAEM